MQSWFPSDYRFNCDNYGDQTEALILAAYKSGSQIEKERHYRAELPIASLHATYYNSHRDPDKSKPIKVQDLCYFKSDEQSRIPTIVGDTFFSLIRDKVMPQWALAIAPLEELRTLKRGLAVSYPRALIGKGIIIFNPRINEDTVEGSYALIVEGVESDCLSDPDNSSTYLRVKIDYEDKWQCLRIVEPELRIDHEWR